MTDRAATVGTMGFAKRFASNPAIGWPVLVAVVWAIPSTAAQVAVLALWVGIAVTYWIVTRAGLGGEMEGYAAPLEVKAEADYMASHLGVEAVPIQVTGSHPGDASLERWAGGRYVLMDAGLLDSPPDRRCAIVGHELAHLRSRVPTGLWIAGLVGSGAVAVLPVGWVALVASTLSALSVILAFFHHSRRAEFAADRAVVETFPELQAALADELAAVADSEDPRVRPGLLDTHPPALWRLFLVENPGAYPAAGDFRR